MKYIIVALLFVGCAVKEDIIVEYRDRNVSIPNQNFTCKDVGYFYFDENTTKKEWRLHVIRLKSGYDSCKKQLKLLGDRYGK